MDYIVVSTSRCRYQEWQLKLLDWSIRKVNQKGRLLLLMSEDMAHQGEEIDFNFSDDVIIVDLPDWAHQWKTEHDDWWGGIPNKFESFYWLADQYPFDPDDRLLFLDPDMIFIEPVDLYPEEDEIIGQKWKNYQPIPGWNQDPEAFMYPFCLRARSLKKIKEDFRAYCIKVRKQENRWESDMWALDYAAKDNGLNISYLEDLGWCTVWRPNGENRTTPIIHYPNVIKNTAGEKIFFKQDYTFDPEQDIRLLQARNQTDYQLLNAVTQSRTDYIFHLKWGFDPVFSDYSGDDGYVFIRPWPGGFNNIRMSLELGVCIAFLTNRTIVLPPSYKMYLLEGESGFHDFFDTNNLGVKSLPFSSFCEMKGITEDENEVKNKSKVLDFDAVHSVLNFEKVPVPEYFLKNRKEIRAQEIFGDAEILYFDKNLLGNFYQSIYTSNHIALKKLIAKYVTYKNEIFDLGWRFINYLGDQSYYSIHIRRNDFQYRELFISCEAILNNIESIISHGSTLYIATDHRDRSFFKPLTEYYHIVFYQDVAEAIGVEKFNPNWIPIVEQLICTRSLKFVGMKLSTLSSYIFRMRGYMVDIDDKNYYINTEPYNDQHQINFAEERFFIGNWAREYKDGWNFSSPEIFISIASYCDQQLIPTIHSILEEAFDPHRLTIGVHLQDTAENYDKLQQLNLPQVKIYFTPREDSKGVVWARNTIKRALYNGEPYFLQIDAHSRFKKNWDLILINQLESIGGEKTLLTTYPNHFDISDDEKKYLDLSHNAPLVIKKFLTDHPSDNRLQPRNKNSLKDYEVQDVQWVSAGFVFARKNWVEDVIIPDNIRFNGEEDFMTFVSFLKGYDLKLSSEAVIWHNYNFKNDKTGEPYKEFNENKVGDNAVNIINHVLFNQQYDRSIKELEEYLGITFKPVIGGEKIFIAISSFIDPDIKATIHDCIQKAKNPKRLHFGICLQYDGNDLVKSTLDEYLGHNNFNVLSVHHSESRGPGWAKHHCQSLYDNERFYLQIDAHTRFTQDWDEVLISNFYELKSITNNPIISFRPPAFWNLDQKSNSEEYQYKDQLSMINIPRIKSIDIDHIPEYEDFNYLNTNYKSIKVPLLDSSFIFSEGKWIHDVPYDPDYYYLGENEALSLRSFTCDYQIFSPRQIICWHKSNPSGNPKHYSFTSDYIVSELHQKSLLLLKRMIMGDQLKYGLGSKRNLADYKNEFGIDFSNRTVELSETKEPEEV
jgi:hypothetical protein